MTVLLGRGECGSHVTLIFTINDDSTNLDEQGSLGVGLCLTKVLKLSQEELKEILK
jgi:pantoate kinase